MKQYSVHASFTASAYLGTVEASSIEEATSKARAFSAGEHHVAVTLNSKSPTKNSRPSVNILHIDRWDKAEGLEFVEIDLKKYKNSIGDKLSRGTGMVLWQYLTLILLASALLASPFVLYYMLSATVGESDYRE